MEGPGGSGSIPLPRKRPTMDLPTPPMSVSQLSAPTPRSTAPPAPAPIPVKPPGPRSEAAKIAQFSNALAGKSKVAVAVESLDYADATTRQPRDSFRKMPPALPPERTWKRALFLTVAIIAAAIFFGMFNRYWTPAHPGVDQNGYLVGGKMMAEHWTTGYKPGSDFAYVGAMWVLADDGVTYYPKYPIGLPAINAALLLANPPLPRVEWLRHIPWMPRQILPAINDAIHSGYGTNGAVWAYLVSPISIALALVGMFMLCRLVSGSFYAVLGMLLLGFTQTTLELNNNPNSHASALACVVWGMFLLARWWQTGSIWRGIIAGLLLGYAVTIRYTEGLLAIPIGVATLTVIRPLNWRSWLRASVPTLAWLVPVLILAFYNKKFMGTWTGYDTTNESAVGKAFTMKEFLESWPAKVEQIYKNGLFLTLPLGIVGLGMMFRTCWRMGLLMTLWFVPGALLYTSYYWGEQVGGTGFLRFYLTLYPPVIVGAMWLLHSGFRGAQATEIVDEDYEPHPLAMFGGGLLASVLAIGGTVAAVYGAKYGYGLTKGDMELLPKYLLWVVPGLMLLGVARFVAYKSNLRGSVAGPLTGGILVASAALVAVYVSVPALESAAASNWNLAYTTARVIEKIKTKDDAGKKIEPLLFAEGGSGMGNLTNHIQFAADIELFSADAFSNGGFFLRRRNANENDPDPVQPARRAKLREALANKSQNDLLAMQRDLIENTLAQGRPVYAIVSAGEAANARRGFVRDSSFAVKTVATWREPAIPIAAGSPGPLGPTNGRGGGGMRSRGPTSWELIQVEMKPPPPPKVTPKPATRPSIDKPPTTEPSTKPAADGAMVDAGARAGA